MRILHEEDGAGNSPGVGESPRADLIRRILGEDVLLLAWPLGKKGTRRRWKDVRLKNTKSPAYLRQLETGNIGVALGKRSNGLCSIDLDSHEAAEAFLDYNPRLQKSLRTRGVKGCNVWVRCVGDYPPTRKLRSRRPDGNGALEFIGEWRADGSQTIVSGRHPTGCDYSFLIEAPPISIWYEEIVWPPEWKAPSPRVLERSGIEHSHPATQSFSNADTQVVNAVDVCFDVSSFIPTARGQSDALIWAMGRRNKKWERCSGRKSTEEERLVKFDLWWKQAKPNLDPAKDYYEYLGKWLRACEKVRYADDESPLQDAWKAANENSLPAEATCLRPERMPRPMQLFVALCYQLQSLQGKDPFFLSCRIAARLLGVSPGTVFNWLGALCNLHVLRKVSTGSLMSRRANEYLYLPLVNQRPRN